MFPKEEVAEFCTVVDPVSGEADALFDTIWARTGSGDSRNQVPVLQFLKRCGDAGVDVICFYGDDWLNLPVYWDWASFEAAVLEGAGQEPPEVYGRLLRP